MLKQLKTFVIASGLLAGTYVSAQRSWSPERISPDRRPAESSLPSELKFLVGLVAVGIYFFSGASNVKRHWRRRDESDLSEDIFQRAHEREVRQNLGAKDPFDPYADQKKTPPGKRRAG